MNEDQKKAIEALSAKLGGVDLKVEAASVYTGEPEDEGVLVVSWGDDPPHRQGAIVLKDGTIDLGGGSWPTDDPLEAWAANRNRELKEDTFGRPGSCDPDVEADATYPACPDCGDPIDYCQGHGEIG